MAVAALLPLVPGQARAWGPLGHATIGSAAVLQLGAPARAELMGILAVEAEDELDEAVSEACFWPDTVRDSPEWSWSASLHYVNLPRTSDRYDRQRDCPDGLCVTACSSMPPNWAGPASIVCAAGKPSHGSATSSLTCTNRCTRASGTIVAAMTWL